MYSDGSALAGDLPQYFRPQGGGSVSAEDLRARQLYPATLPFGFAYGVMERTPAGWLMDSMASSTPQDARDGLGWWFRILARTRSTPEPAREEYWRASARLEEERLNDLSVAGRRFRVVRGFRFHRFSRLAGPEPPRPTDPDEEPAPPPRKPWKRTDKFTGGLLPAAVSPGGPELLGERLDFVPRGDFVPPEVTRDAADALTRFPKISLLPTRYAVAERRADGMWEPRRSVHDSPGEARRSLALRFDHLDDFELVDGTGDEERKAYAEAARRLESEPLKQLTVAGRRFRIIRVQTLVRVGPDGPEPVRPSDYDPEPPMTGETAALRTWDLIDDEE